MICFIKIQSENMKMTLKMTFFKCDGFTVL